VLGSTSWNDESLYNSIPTNIKQYYDKYCDSDVDDDSSWRLEESLQHPCGGGVHADDW
jgi:hypothetical protein